MREVADAFSCPEVHGEVRDVHSVKKNLACVRAGQAHDDIKCCGFARPIGPQQTHHLSLSDLKVNVINNLAALVRLR